jgi:hypothetical protein
MIHSVKKYICLILVYVKMIECQQIYMPDIGICENDTQCQQIYLPDIGMCGNDTQCQQIYHVKTEIVKSVLFKYIFTTHLNKCI